ncbi:hypothetical protein H2199_005366 [Coniosporium tulheliwenetii]|uniref:Uncharacterized protein n=1 Tax=Coniosporium tulheliwenetii TaxID=3383036 RepID=A0ACC2Z1C9_9PEZI|nr:hypothetical protein H2199_005366 [Cladosporium sp. JES 115]
MGFDYAVVHLKYTIPVAIALTFVYRPLLTRLDEYKILFLVTIAVVSTIPWDSHLIRTRIWSYPLDAIVGPTLFAIPAEEIFFFVVQTYNTTLLYLLLSKPTFHPIYLRNEKHSADVRGTPGALRRYWKWAGQLILSLSIGLGIALIRRGGAGVYMGLILVWACPFLLLLWSLAYQFIVGLPKSNTVLSIFAPTLYLWIVDTLALKRGTWVIESGTKLGIHVWPHLEIEEAVFFLLTNTLIIFGLVAFDNALAILDTFPDLFPELPAMPSPLLLVKALLTPASKYDEERIAGLTDAVARLRKKSRSFYLASGTFEGRLRIDMIILYSFCRVADDLIDEGTVDSSRQWINRLRTFLDRSYNYSEKSHSVRSYVVANFPPWARKALLQLPTTYLPKQPLYDLLKGFEMDLIFSENPSGNHPTYFPIVNANVLDFYGACVAGTVAELCLELVFHHLPGPTSPATRRRLVDAGAKMGIALQYVNIARDIAVDAAIKRVYIPTSWLEQEDLTPEAVIKNPEGVRIERLRQRLLDRAFAIYGEARGAIEELPVEARAPMRVAVESYMEIGRVLRQKGYQVKAGRPTVPKLRRVLVAWRALSR